MHRAQKVILLIFAAAALLAALVLSITAILSYGPRSQRNALATRYVSNTTLPPYLTYKGRTSEGDGLDSQPYWYYFYDTTRDPATTLTDVKTSLEHSGYTTGIVEDSSTAELDPKTQYEFNATKKAQQLRLVVAIQNDNTVSITVGSE